MFSVSFWPNGHLLCERVFFAACRYGFLKICKGWWLWCHIRQKTWLFFTPYEASAITAKPLPCGHIKNKAGHIYMHVQWCRNRRKLPKTNLGHIKQNTYYTIDSIYMLYNCFGVRAHIYIYIYIYIYITTLPCCTCN